MQIDVFTTHRPDTSPRLREQLTRRLGRALARFESRVHRATLTLSDDNGPRAGADDKICRLEVELANGYGYIRVESRGETVLRATHRALRRVRRAIAERARVPSVTRRRLLAVGMLVS